MSLCVKYGSVPTNYLCIQCNAIGDHWIMKCGVFRKNDTLVIGDRSLKVIKWYIRNEYHSKTSIFPKSLNLIILKYYYGASEMGDDLLRASYIGNIDVVRTLISNSVVDINYKDSYGNTSLYIASQNNYTEIVELLLHPNKITLPFGAFGMITIKSANPNIANTDECTPLWIAASKGNVKCMSVLINYGADLNKPTISQIEGGSTPLCISCQNGNKNAVEMLLAANADTNRPTSDGTTPLIIAASSDYFDIVNMLLRSGADAMQNNTVGWNAFSVASIYGHKDSLEIIYQHLLMIKNPEEIIEFVNCGDVSGLTPLHWACIGGHENVIEFLIDDVRVDIFKKDHDNKTGLEYAHQNGHQSIVTWLSQKEKQYHVLQQWKTRKTGQLVFSPS